MSDSWRRYTWKCLCWCVDREVVKLVQPRRSNWGLLWGLLCGTSVKRKLCMVPSHICHICKIWRSKKVEECSKVIIWVGSVSHNGGGGASLMGKARSSYVILLYWNFIVSLTEYCKYFCWFTCFVSLEVGKAKSAS